MDPAMTAESTVGQPVVRADGRDKVTGVARYAFEHMREGIVHGWIVQSTIARGRILSIDRDALMSLPGIVEVLTFENAPRVHDCGDGELMLLQDDVVHYRGQVVALVIAETPEAAREGAESLQVTYSADQPELDFDTRHPRRYAPAHTNAFFATDSRIGDVAAAMAASEHSVDVEYETSAAFNSPMEPHATLAEWVGDRLELIDSLQGANWARGTLAALFDMPEEMIRIQVEHVGGGFGSKGPVRANSVLAAMAARVTGRPVKLTLTRQMMFGLTGYRTPTISHLRLAAGTDGGLTGIAHEAFGLVSPVQEFTEQTAVPTRHMYAAPNRLTTHRVVALNVPTPSFMRGPGETPGMFALESAIDELAAEIGIDPIELRVRNEPDEDPEEHRPWSSRKLVECLRRGAERFDWSTRDPRPGLRRDGRWLVGTGVAAAIYPADTWVSSAAATAQIDGRYLIELNATDIGTGARTVLAQVAAAELGVPLDAVTVAIGDTDLPPAPVAGGSFGTSSWSFAIVKACRELRARRDGEMSPTPGLRVVVNTAEDVAAFRELSRFAFGAHFVEARVDIDSGEVTVPRMLGVFGAGRIINPRTARSQLIGGMAMGLSMALHEHADIDTEFGSYSARDFAGYHIASNADVLDLDVEWVDEFDGDINPLGAKGVGEIGMVGAAAAVANAVWHATGVRVRSLPVTPDKLLAHLPTTESSRTFERPTLDRNCIPYTGSGR